MALSAGQLRFLFGPGGPYFKLKGKASGGTAEVSAEHHDHTSSEVKLRAATQKDASGRTVGARLTGERRDGGASRFSIGGVFRSPRPLAIGAAAAAGAATAAQAARETARRKAAIGLRMARRDWKRYSEAQGIDSVTQIRQAGEVAKRELATGGVQITRPIMAAPAGPSRTVAGHRSLGFRFVDQNGHQVGGGGVTVDPEGNAFVGGSPETAFWSFVPIRRSEVKGMIDKLQAVEPSVKRVIGTTPGRARAATRGFQKVEEAAAQTAQSINEQAAKGGLNRLAARVRRTFAEGAYLKKSLDAQRRAPLVIPLDGKPPKLAAEQVLAAQDRNLQAVGGQALVRGTKLKRVVAKTLLAGAAVGAVDSLAERRAVRLEAAGRGDEARRERDVKKVVLGGAALVAGAGGLRRGFRRGVLLGRRLAAH